MARIKITDLPVDKKISKEELKNVRGGALIFGTSRRPAPSQVHAPVPLPYPNVGGGSGLITTGGKETRKRKPTFSPSKGDEPGTSGGGVDPKGKQFR